MYRSLLLTLIIFTLICFSCNERISNPLNIENGDTDVYVDPYGKTNQFELATWNIENFPKSGKSPP